jgi:hypothetical protein
VKSETKNFKGKRCEKKFRGSETKQKICFFFSLRSEMKNLKRIEAKTSEKIGPLFTLEHAKTKQNKSRFASFRFEAKLNF